MNRDTFFVIVERDGEGYFLSMPRGNFYEEAYERIQDATLLCVEDQIVWLFSIS